MESKVLQIPFRDPLQKPAWAALIRRGGDHVSILFEELRSRLSKVKVMAEDREFDPDEGWLVSYRCGGLRLCRIQILPGKLTGLVELTAKQVESIVKERRCPSFLKDVLLGLEAHPATSRIKFPLNNKSQVGSFAALVIRLSPSGSDVRATRTA